MAWTFYLTITNATDRDLEITSASKEWGTWRRDNVDGRGPCAVPAGKTVQALGIRAEYGTWTGYECHAQWMDVVPESAKSYGGISLRVDVPFSGSNESELSSAGAVAVDGWTQLPSSGHDFSRSVTVRVGQAGRLVATLDEKAADPTETEYTQFLVELAARNPDVRDWSAVQDRLAEVEDFNLLEYLPKEISLTERLVARSEPMSFEKPLWAGIGDPDYPNPYSQSLFVDDYFAVAVYGVGTDPRGFITVPAGAERKVSKRVTITSAIKQVLTTRWSLKTSLSIKAVEPVSGSEVASSLDMEMGIENVLEESTETVSEKIIEETFKAPDDADLTIVPWVFSTAVIIYRKDKQGRHCLVAVSEWARAQLFKSYRMPVS